MNTEEQARERMAQQHLTDQERHQKMANRAAEVEHDHPETEINEKARESLAKERQHQTGINENMLHRTTEEIE